MPRLLTRPTATPPARGADLLTAAVALAGAVLLTLTLLAPVPAAAAPAAPAAGTTTGDRLTSGAQLASGATLVAVGSAHRLSVQPDGDVTVRLGTGPVLWHTGTTGNPGARLVQQPSGALEVRSTAGAVLWSTGVASPGARSIIKPDGVLYTVDTAGSLAWKSTPDGPALRTGGAGDRLPSGGVLLAGESVGTGDVRLAMGGDGDLVLTRAGTPVWRSGTAARGAHARVTPDGALQVVAVDGSVRWTSGTSAPGARLVVKDHARIYLITTAGASAWSTATPTGAPVPAVPAVVSLPLPAALPLPVRPGAGIGGGTGLGGGSGTDAGGGTDERVYRTVLQRAPQYADPASTVAEAARTAQAEGRSADAALLARAASGGAARWLGPADGTAEVRAYAAAATAAARTPVLVTYAIPDRDCGNHSAGGFATPAEYRAWVDRVAAGLRGSSAVVVVEPDALLHLDRCGNRDDRTALLRYSVTAYAAAGAEVYLDAASSNSFGWSAAQLQEMALRLRAAGVDRAAGFSVNVSNFQRTDHEVAYGRYLSALLGGPAFVIDTSRNGNGPLPGPDGTVWCNPEGRALGALPAATGSGPHVANLWVKTVGRSDGLCGGGPAAGTYWEPYLLGMAQRAGW
ncbi:glycoside hydrolase family 6 protein [Cellulomonas sp. NPDC058312]|uniref:glycoside hydrolase family 6 protein n=1 Tax=Cellulomonas sp. NPDC058312 TaxID=3346441 RepID=UPI0036E904F4